MRNHRIGIFACVIGLIGAGWAQGHVAASPDGRLAVRLELQDGAPTWSAARDGKPFLRPGALGMVVWGQETGAVEEVSWKVSEHREEVATAWGKTARYDDHYRQGEWTLREAGGAKRTWRVVVRAYDSGVALRYEFPKGAGLAEAIPLTGEQTEFRFAVDGRAWCYNGERDPAGPQPLSRFHAGNGARLPLVVECAPDLTVAVLEAAIFDIAPFGLIPFGKEKTAFRAQFASSRLPGGGATSWRVLLVGDRPGDLLVSPLPYCLNPPGKIADTSWIKPGLAMWDWRAWGARTDDGFTYALDMASWRRMIDFASRHGIPFLVLDANWYGPEFDPKSDPRTSRDHLVEQPDPKKPHLVRKPAPADWKDPIDVPAIIRYGNGKGVGVVLYFNDIARNNYPFEETLALYREWGAAGIKYGFMKGKGQRKVLDTRTIVEACARHRLVCDFHDGPVPPSGDRRTYPNYLAREFCHSQSDAMRVFSPTGFCEQVFVNMLAGPLDMCNGLYTLENPAEDRPKIFTNVESTVVAETARVMIVFSGLSILPDCPEAYEAKADLFDFLSHMPGSWDETRILHGRIGECITTARRSGKKWYIASATNEEARTLPVKLDFLEPGMRYAATLYEDASDAHFQENREAYRVRKIEVKQGDSIEAVMAPGGGHCIKLVPTDSL
jgi:alpha-glucosidase